jgi:hypothetical protein
MSANTRNQNMDSWNQYKDSDFSCLSECLTEKQRKIRNVIKVVVPFKTYKDELRDKYRDARSATENIKTRMCNSLDKNEVCRVPLCSLA